MNIIPNRQTSSQPKKRRRLSARPSIARMRQAGRASDFILYAADHLQPGDEVILYLRVSTHPQAHDGNLIDQERNLRRVVAEMGAVVVAVVTYEGSGTFPYPVARAAALAEKHGAKILAESTDRFIRHEEFDGEHQELQATQLDLEYLSMFAKGATLMTVVDPDASQKVVSGYQKRRGQQEKGNTGGRPPKRKLPPRKPIPEDQLALIDDIKTLWNHLPNVRGEGCPMDGTQTTV